MSDRIRESREAGYRAMEQVRIERATLLANEQADREQKERFLSPEGIYLAEATFLDPQAQHALAGLVATFTHHGRGGREIKIAKLYRKSILNGLIKENGSKTVTYNGWKIAYGLRSQHGGMSEITTYHDRSLFITPDLNIRDLDNADYIRSPGRLRDKVYSGNIIDSVVNTVASSGLDWVAHPDFPE